MTYASSCGYEERRATVTDRIRTGPKSFPLAMPAPADHRSRSTRNAGFRKEWGQRGVEVARPPGDHMLDRGRIFEVDERHLGDAQSGQRPRHQGDAEGRAPLSATRLTIVCCSCVSSRKVGSKPPERQ